MPPRFVHGAQIHTSHRIQCCQGATFCPPPLPTLRWYLFARATLSPHGRKSGGIYFSERALTFDLTIDLIIDLTTDLTIDLTIDPQKNTIIGTPRRDTIGTPRPPYGGTQSGHRAPHLAGHSDLRARPSHEVEWKHVHKKLSQETSTLKSNDFY